MNIEGDAGAHYSGRTCATREALEERLAIMEVDGKLEFELARRIAFAVTCDAALAEQLLRHAKGEPLSASGRVRRWTDSDGTGRGQRRCRCGD